MDNGMVTIHLPKALCSALSELAEYAGDSENATASYAIAFLFRRAVEKGEVKLDDPVLLNVYKPYDQVTEQGGWNWDNANEFDRLLTDALK